MHGTLHIRPVTIEDAKILFDWRNDPETVAQSITKKPVEWAEHLEWLGKVVKGTATGRSLYIVESEGEPAGTVRSDERSDGFTEVSYTVAPAFRGKGLGKRMVVQFAHEYLGRCKLAARIKKGTNPASESIARALGLQPFSETPSKTAGDSPIVEWR